MFACVKSIRSSLWLQIFTKRIKEGVWDVTAVVDSGGMPSSHSSLCMVSRVLLLFVCISETRKSDVQVKPFFGHKTLRDNS